MKKSKNLSLWEELGEHLLVLQPFMDNLIEKGDGCYLIDADGNRILDMAAGQFCSILGHSHPVFNERLKKHVENIIHLGDQYVSRGILQAAQRLTSVTPGELSKVVFLSTGSEANECAMRMAKVVTDRSGMVAFSRGYYGISLATRTLSSISDYPWKIDFQPAPINQHKLITPTCYRCPIFLEFPSCDTACLDVSLESIGQHLENVAAVIVEPVLSAGGMIFPEKEYLVRLRKIAKDIGALFIVDEAQTGFGRCGQWFDIQNYSIEPDIMVLSKTAGNGYPAAAVVVSDDVAKKLEQKAFTHLSSHQNDPLAAATVHTVIDIVEEENLVAHSKEMGAYFVERLQELKSEHPIIFDIRHRGLMIGLELDPARNNSSGNGIGFNFVMLCERKGLHVTSSYYETVIRFIPPLIISKAEIDHAISIMQEVFAELTSNKAKSGYVPQNARSRPFIKRLAGARTSKEIIQKLWTTSPKQWVKKLSS